MIAYPAECRKLAADSIAQAHPLFAVALSQARLEVSSGKRIGHDTAMDGVLLIRRPAGVADISASRFTQMAFKRVWLPCPACRKPIALSLSKAARFDFQVGCMECKTISHSADLLNAMKAN
jgi:hypothetical protein